MEKNREILILVGIPASGKSTWAKEYVRNHSDYVRVNRDDFRSMLKNAQTCENKIEDMITSLVYSTIDHALAKKLNVIVDNTNLKAKYIVELMNRFIDRADINFRIFDISLRKAIERDSARDSKVGEAVIEKLFNDYKVLIDSFAFQPVKKENKKHLVPNFESTLKPAVIFDLDGTLALMGNRGPFDWDRVDGDDLNKIVAEHVNHHLQLGRKIILMSGRDETSRQKTEDWLNFYKIPWDKLYMRTAGDYRKDTVVKRELYENFVKGEYNVLCAYDDRLSVCKLWADLKVFTFTVNQGLVEF